MSRKNKGRNASGFTLLEIMIALFIFSIIAIIMTAALHHLLELRTETDRKAGELAHLQIASLLLAHDIEQAINREGKNAQGASEKALAGTADTLQLTHAGLPNPGSRLTRSTLQRTEWGLNAQHALVRRNFPHPDRAEGVTPNERTVLQGINFLKFTYLDNKGKFHETWPPHGTNETILPQAIRVLLDLEGQGKLVQLYPLPAAE